MLAQTLSLLLAASSAPPPPPGFAPPPQSPPPSTAPALPALPPPSEATPPAQPVLPAQAATVVATAVPPASAWELHLDLGQLAQVDSAGKNNSGNGEAAIGADRYFDGGLALGFQVRMASVSPGTLRPVGLGWVDLAGSDSFALGEKVYVTGSALAGLYSNTFTLELGVGVRGAIAYAFSDNVHAELALAGDLGFGKQGDPIFLHAGLGLGYTFR